jgi:hypothetical protein
MTSAVILIVGILHSQWLMSFLLSPPSFAPLTS